MKTGSDRNNIFIEKEKAKYLRDIGKKEKEEREMTLRRMRPGLPGSSEYIGNIGYDLPPRGEYPEYPEILPGQHPVLF